jgi:lipopolysaccharide export system protein LptC
MRFLKNIFVIGGLGLVAAFSLWLQFEAQEEEPIAVKIKERHDPDYYIENFTATILDENGKLQHTLQAERLVHYPDDNTALLDKPHVTSYSPGKPPTNAYAESGWLSPNHDEVLLTGNVRIVRGKGVASKGGAATTEKMRIKLKKKKNNN